MNVNMNTLILRVRLRRYGNRFFLDAHGVREFKVPHAAYHVSQYATVNTDIAYFTWGIDRFECNWAKNLRCSWGVPRAYLLFKAHNYGQA